MPTEESGDGASSQGDTEPLTFEDEGDAEGEMDDDQDMLEAEATNALMASSLTRGGDAAQASTAEEDAELIDGAEEEEGDEEDEDAEVESNAEEEGDDNADVDGEGEDEGDEDGMGSDEDDDEEEGQEENDDITQSQTTAGNSSPNKAAIGATFSDESDLTDEPDEEDEDAEGEDDGEENEEGDDEDEEGDEEDEAAKSLAALTSGQTAGLNDDGSASADANAANSGLEALSVLAAAEAGEESQGEEGTDNDSITGSQLKHKSRKHPSAIPRRTATRLNEVIVASPQLSEDDDDDEEDEDESGNGLDDKGSGPRNISTSNKGNRALSSLIGLSNVAKRNSRQGAAGLLAGAPSITIEGLASGVPSAATSREASPALEEGDERRLGEEYKTDLEQERDEAGTPVQEIDEAQAEDEPTTDEAALKRQEAMDSLTKIEIGFALLRDKLYVERMDEVNKEGEMILNGTHPDLIHLSNLIENRRERKLKLVDKWFEQEEKQYERVAKAEEAAAWNNWRNEVVELRKQQMNEAARKRRKLDREKRSLDGPRPARRHQLFETELTRNPDYDRKMRLHQHHNKKAKTRDENEMGAYVAFPDLRGAEEHESWMDMERMGIAPDARFMAMPPGGYYRPEDMGMDPYAIYPMEQPAPGPDPGYMPYGAPLPAEFAPYERQYDGRGSGQHAYVVDGYGRPLSPPPPPASHIFPVQRGGGVRPAESYVEPSHHTHSSYGPKVNRRSPPPNPDERELKQRTSGQILNSPAINPHQGVRPPSSSRPPTHYAKHGNTHSDEAVAYYNAPPAKSSMNAMGHGSISSAPRPSGPSTGQIAGSYMNRHDQFSR